MTAPLKESINIDHLRTWVGREQEAFDVVSPELVHKYRATLNMPEIDVKEGDSAPHLLHFCLGQPVIRTDSLGEDGHPVRGGFLPPVPLQRRMWAGGQVQFHKPLRIGDAIKRTSRIMDVTAKVGRTGLLCFVSVEHIIYVRTEAILTERQDLVYREPVDSGKPVKKLEIAPSGSHMKSVEPVAPMLFRYSALTFNSHRIHYDFEYVTKVEGYSGLVVHGPLQAALLINFAKEIAGKPPVSFSFRGVSPLIGCGRFNLHADPSPDNSFRLWAARSNGPQTMVAKASWL